MRCPFPGMDPYLESGSFWNDFSVSFLVTLSNSLLRELFPRYEAFIEPYPLERKLGGLTQRRLRVIHRPSERLVTAIELLSPANKSPDTVPVFL